MVSRAIFGVLLSMLFASSAAPATQGNLTASIEASLPDHARGALARITGEGRQLLALTNYLRSAATLDQRWSWSNGETTRYEQTVEYANALTAIANVTQMFETRNPGYTLHVNTQVRSLDVQLDHWNTNATVASAARQLEHEVHEYLARKPTPTVASLKAFLMAWRPDHPVSLAAPGLSPHGQARAFDFQIQQGDRIVAGTDTLAIESVWDGEGWTMKLKDAVNTSRAPFAGPLERPREPWHYDYRP
jgi:hypothetical protein